MNCKNCGKLLKVGCVYCPNCGTETSVAAESEFIDDEWLHSLLREDEEITEEIQPSQSQQEKLQEHKAKRKAAAEKKKKKKRQMALVTTVCVVLALLVVLVLVLRAKQSATQSTYEYQLQKAQECVENHNYSKALTYYSKALEMKENDTSLMVAIAQVSILMEDYSTALEYLTQVIELDPSNAEAYEALITVYEKKKNTTAILELMETVTDEEILALFSNYQTGSVQFSIEAGTYYEAITVSLSSVDEGTIYYTTNGKDPVEYGTKYQTAITFKTEGTYQIKAVLCNSYGTYGDVVSATYVIEFIVLDVPVASLSGGTVTEATQITLSSTSEGTIYYTWDGSTPTESSNLYTGAISIPTGTNTLKAVLIDDKGNVSDVMTETYTYTTE